MSFKEAVNHYLRLGLHAPVRGNRKPFTVTPRALGLPQGMSYDNIGELLEALEGGTRK